MNFNDFQDQSAGKCIKLPTGDWSFVPAPLPPKLSFDNSLVSLLSNAARELGELSGLGRQLPNPYLLIGLFTRKEAISSSRIEGTVASLNDLFQYEAEGVVPAIGPDVYEVRNHVLALERGIDLLKSLPLSLRLIKEVHKVLLQGVRGNESIPGYFREVQNWIGPPGSLLSEARYVPPPVLEMKQAMFELEKYLHSSNPYPPLIDCALVHYQFEAIHPFLDGNGRIGRLLITLSLCGKGYLSHPLLNLSEFFERHRTEYNTRLLQVSQEGKWREWLEFFLRGMIEQSGAAITSSNEILGLHEQYVTRVKTSEKLPYGATLLIDEIFKQPFVTVPFLSKKCGKTFPTVKKWVLKLVDAGILTESGKRKTNKLYYAPELVRLLTETKKNRT